VIDWQATLIRVRRALMRRGRSEHDAEDLVQEAWIRLERYAHFHEVVKPEAFLMRAAINLSIDARRTHTIHGDDVLLEETELVDTAPSAEATLLARERVARMGVGLGRLTGKTRAIFLSHRIDGATYQEIARAHGISVTAVEKHVAKAAYLLTEWMEGW
jgi:RNA polymerase sigma-70 factor (ECF subfamily)